MGFRATNDYQLLLADDDSRFRESLRELLEPAFVLVEVECGEEALVVVETQHIDLILMDVHMLVMTGIETLQTMRALEIVLPCILITGNPSTEIIEEAEKANAFSVLTKPVKRAEIVATVSAVMETTYDDETTRRILEG